MEINIKMIDNQYLSEILITISCNDFISKPMNEETLNGVKCVINTEQIVTKYHTIRFKNY